MDDELIIEYVACIKRTSERTETIHPDSVETACHKCHTDLWVMPHNLTKSPICINCLKNVENPNFQLRQEDILKAMEYLNSEKEKP